MNCKNNVYEKIKKKIEIENKNTKFCYVQGPTGPIGPMGPMGPQGESGMDGAATIKIGTTETGDYNTQAMVTNVGTKENVILNFKIPQGIPGEKGETGPEGKIGPQGKTGESEHISIDGAETVTSLEEAQVLDDFENNIHHLKFYIPKGEKGEIGPAGPRGLPGEIGISEHISIDGVETVTAQEDAQVIDDFESNIHHLTFYLPQGEKGEKGEQGDPGIQGPRGEPYGLGAYGERYSDSTEMFEIQPNTETIIPLDKTGPAIFTSYNSSYAIEIVKYGTYLINFFLNIATSTDVNYTITVKASGTRLPGSQIKVSSKANVIQNVYGSVTFSLVEKDEVVLVITPDQTTNLIFDGTTNAKISVIKID